MIPFSLNIRTRAHRNSVRGFPLPEYTYRFAAAAALVVQTAGSRIYKKPPPAAPGRLMRSEPCSCPGEAEQLPEGDEGLHGGADDEKIRLRFGMGMGIDR